METQIATCPDCGIVLPDNSPECHGCGHIFDRGQADAIVSRPAAITAAAERNMEICSNCGESCRIGLVRCWNCSKFLRPEIEAAFKKMRQSGKYEVERVELPIIDASQVTQQDSLLRRASTPESLRSSQSFSNNDEFELSDGAQFDIDDAETFELNENLALPMLLEPQEEDSDTSEVFALQVPLVENKPSFESAFLEEPPIQRDELEPPIQYDPTAEPVGLDDVVAPPLAPEDELLKIAADEELDIKQVRKSLRSKDTFLIFCPMGCRIRVKERHRGKSGKCPRCQSPFVVPKKTVAKVKDSTNEQKPDPIIESPYKKWLTDIRLHTVDPLKLKIKADSLLNDCQPVDLGFAVDGLLIATLLVGKFGANLKKYPPLRQSMLEHFLKQGTVETLAVPTKKVYTQELLAHFTIAQPTPFGTESLFADVPVFGVNRIAVRIPKMADDNHAKYLSFCLSEFRAFLEGVKSICPDGDLGSNSEIPLTDEYQTLFCQIQNVEVLELMKVNYYQKDPGFKLEVSGWRCAACGLIMSEAARLESKFGGANAKSIAKTKCPSCENKFGNLPLYQLAGAGKAKTDEEPPAE